MILDLTAYVIIPIYTLVFVNGTNWLTSNLSVIGSFPTRQSAFFVLGIIIGFYYHTVLRRLLAPLPNRRLEYRLLHIALVLIILAVSIPYLPDSVPLQSFLHLVFAFVASLMLLLCLYLTIWKLSRLSDQLQLILRPYRILLIFITLFSVLLLCIAGIISTALEVFFVITTTVMVQRLYRQFTCNFPDSIYNK